MQRNLSTHRLSYLRALDSVNQSLATAVSLRSELTRAAVSEMATERTWGSEESFTATELEWFRSSIKEGV